MKAAEWSIDEDGLLVIAPPEGCERAVISRLRYRGADESPWEPRKAEVRSILVKPGVAATWGAYCLFEGLNNLERADVSALDVSRVDDMGSMFGFCPSLQALDLRGWDVSHVDSMDGMFKCCSSLRSLDLSGWDVSGVNDMSGMFEGCSALRSLDLSGWEVLCVDAMDSMFSGCSSLASLDLSGWDVSWVEHAEDMFMGCKDVELVLDGCSEESAARLRALLP